MSLLDSFLMVFESDGLKELPDEAQEAEQSLDNLEDAAKDVEKTAKKLDKSVLSNVENLKKLAGTTLKTIAPFVALGKAIHGAMEFASQAVEISEAAEKAGMTLEQFQLQDGNKYAIFTRDDVNNAKEYEMNMRDIRMGTMSIGANISRMLMPALIAVSKIVRNIVDFLTKHGTLIQILAGMTAIGGGIYGIVKVIQFAGTPAIKLFGKSLWAALAPILPIIIAVTATLAGLALLIEDLIVWVNGGESAFGELWDEIFGGVEGAKELFKEFTDAIKTIWEVAKPIFDGLIDLILKGIFYALKAVVTVLAAVAKGIRALTGKSVDVSVNQNVNGSHADGLDYVPYDGYIAELHKGERVQTADEANDWRSGLTAAKKAINLTASYPLNSIPSGAVSNAYNNSTASKTFNISGITIQTQATDAQGIATDFAQYIKQAVINLDDGMLA
ncbi:MAG: hypothetical protein II244_02800 [Clostridia bacterium]|nr:hypothetical protein [Clostridia bacterium]